VGHELVRPSASTQAQDAINDNIRSCVLRVTSRSGSLLLPGDTEHRAERDLLDSAAERLAADVLLAPHHGSATSSSPPFIAAVHPAVTIFTMGDRNRFRHPKPAVVKRYAASGSRLYRSDTDGAILLRFS